MTWSQLIYFERATSHAEADRLIAQLAIAHNPYAKDGTKLQRRFEFRARRAQRGGRRPVYRGPQTPAEFDAGMQQLERSVMGVAVQRVTVTPEEMQAILAGGKARKLTQ